jgi:hypothetical protein
VCSVANWLPCQPFPPELLVRWLQCVVTEVLEERVSSSRGRQVPRGVKRKASRFNVRTARAPTQPRTIAPKIEPAKIPIAK